METPEALGILHQVFQSFPPESQEAKAIERACEALVFVTIHKTRSQFEHFIQTKNRPLNGLELLQLKVYGIDIPDEAKTPDVLELVSEIDMIANKLRCASPSRLDNRTSGEQNTAE